MPLPRYSPSEVRLQPGAASVAYNAQAQSWQNLSQKLDQFSGMMYNQLAEDRKREATEQAVIDVAQGKYKDVGDFTIYDKVYKNIGNAAYASKTEQDAKEYSEFLRVKLDSDPQTKNNPELYRQTFDKYSQTILNEAPNEETRAVLNQSINKWGMAQYNAILSAKTKELNEYTKKSYEEGINLYTQEYKDAVVSKDTDAINIATQKLMGIYQTGIDNKLISENGVKDALNTLKKDTFKEISMQEFKDSKNRLGYLKTIRENKVLDSEETNKLVDSMHKLMQSEYDDRKLIRLKQEKNESDFKKNTKKNLQTKLLNGILTQKDLDEAAKYNGITLSEYDNFLERISTPGATSDDNSTYLFYRRNIDTASEEEILDDENLTKATKVELLNLIDANEKQAKLDIKEQEKIAKEQANWQGAKEGKQAIFEIKENFGIRDGAIMSKADINNDNGKDYLTLRTMLFDEVESLPLEERIPKSLIIGRRLLKEYSEGEIFGTKPYKVKQDEMAKFNRQGAITKEQFEQSKKQEEIKGGNQMLKFIEMVSPEI